MVQGSAARPMQMCPKCSQNNTLTARSCIHCGSPLPSIPLLAKNTVLNNRYTVLQVLGFGGFSAVYLAFDQRLSNRKVAVKELLHTDPAIVQQFETEAKLLATLSHPALPKAFDWFKQFGTDRYYLVMEFIDGVSAWEVVNRNGPMTPLSALRLMEPVFDAVAYLHRQNPPILHRDIKPQNILVSRERKVYLVDFGIAKVGGAGQKTATGARGVTPGFSPPEQYLATGEIDVRSDIYSLGATMYFLLTGKVPPDATERLQREMAGQPSLEPIRSVNAAVSQQVEQAIMIAMALRKEQRFNNVGEFLAGLKGQTIQPPMPQPSPQQPMPQPPVQPPAMQPSSVPGPARTQASKQAGKVKEVECYLCGSTIAPDEPRYRRYVLKGFSLGSYSSSGYRSSHGTSLSFGKSARFGSSDRYGSSHRYGSSRREHYSLQTICRQCALRMRNKQLAYHSGGAGVLCAILGFLLFGWKGAVLGFIGAVLGFIAGFAVVYVLLSRQPLSPGPD